MVTNPEGDWEEGVVCWGRSLHQGSRRADGGGPGPGADLRDGPGTGTIRLSRGAQRPGRRQAGPRAAEYGAYGGDRRGLERLLRQHPARRVDEVGLPSRERSAPPGADRGVAGIAGGRDRRARPPPPNDPRQGRTAGDPARVSPVTVVVKHVYASFRARLEGAGA